MTDRSDVDAEGWAVRHRPAVIAAVAVPCGLAACLFAAGWLYDRDLRPAARQPVTPFPAPGLETEIHDGARDPHRPLAPVRSDPRIAVAKRAVVGSGIAGWEDQR